MPNGKNLLENEDKAWAAFKTPLDKDSLLEFCQDVERLLRINPYLVFKKWEKIDARRYRFHAVNHSQIHAFNIETDLQILTTSNGLEIHYALGLKSKTIFAVEATPEGSKLTITEKYKAMEADEHLSRLHEVDKSLTKWAEEIQDYLVYWQRWSWFIPWRLYMQRIWQPMKPAARRITYMLLWISIIEITLISLGVIIYFVEYK